MKFSIIISYSYSTRIKQIPIKGYTRKKLNQTIADACGLEAFRYCVMSTILHQQQTEMHSKLNYYNHFIKQDMLNFWYWFLFQDCPP